MYNLPMIADEIIGDDLQTVVGPLAAALGDLIGGDK
jgi:hypothetical protein